MHPVRFLTSDNNGNLCYGYDGEIYTVKEGTQPKKVDVQIISDKVENDLIHQLKASGATDIAVSPNGKEVAFIVRGDVYVTSVDYETTKQITNTPQQERDLDFSPDGRSLVYSAERGETWGVYQSSLVRKNDKYFTYAQELKEEPSVAHTGLRSSPLKEVIFWKECSRSRVHNQMSRVMEDWWCLRQGSSYPFLSWYKSLSPFLFKARLSMAREE